MTILKKVFYCIITLHKHGIYQSDIKPSNIAFHRHALHDEYEPKLVDFGGATTNYNIINA